MPSGHCSPLWAPQKCAPRFYEGHENAAPLCERFNNVHHGFKKALKRCISFLWVLDNYEPRFTKAIKQRSSFVRALQQRASRFYEGLKNAHLRCMSPWKICTGSYDGHKTCISCVWALQQCASRLYDGLRNAHLLLYESLKNMNHDLWRS